MNEESVDNVVVEGLGQEGASSSSSSAGSNRKIFKIDYPTVARFLVWLSQQAISSLKAYMTADVGKNVDKLLSNLKKSCPGEFDALTPKRYASLENSSLLLIASPLIGEVDEDQVKSNLPPLTNQFFTMGAVDGYYDAYADEVSGAVIELRRAHDQFEESEESKTSTEQKVDRKARKNATDKNRGKSIGKAATAKKVQSGKQILGAEHRRSSLIDMTEQSDAEEEPAGGVAGLPAHGGENGFGDMDNAQNGSLIIRAPLKRPIDGNGKGDGPAKRKNSSALLAKDDVTHAKNDELFFNLATSFMQSQASVPADDKFAKKLEILKIQIASSDSKVSAKASTELDNLMMSLN